MSQERKLEKFNSLYNKFIFEWSEGKPLADIVKILKDQNNTCCSNTKCQQQNVQQAVCNDQECCSQDDIKNCFYDKFPKFLIIKCQNKFPIDDELVVPEDIITKYWDENKETILKSLARCIKDALINQMQNLFVEIFGKQDQYNQNLFNESALKLVSLME